MKANAEFGMRNVELRPRFAVEVADAAGSAQLTFDTTQSADPHARVPGNPQLIELHIDELLLYGFAPGDRHRIAEGVQQELGRLLLAQDLSTLLACDVAVDELDGGSIRLSAGGQAAATGSQIAGAVFGAASSVINPAELPAAAPAPGGETRL